MRWGTLRDEQIRDDFQMCGVEIPIRYPNGYIKLAVGHVSLEFQGQSKLEIGI